MNSASCLPSASLSTTTKSCHPERSLAKSEAKRQTQSKDPVRARSTTDNQESFRTVIRFFGAREDDYEADYEAEPYHETSREAAIECSPRRKPWVRSGT